MFESFVTDSGKSLDSSLNPSLTGLAGNLEPMDNTTSKRAFLHYLLSEVKRPK